MGTICWLYPAEIFPNNVRAKAVSVSTLANWIMNVAIADMVPQMLVAMSASGLFFFFGCFGVVCGLFVYVFVPETKGKSLEEIDAMWSDSGRARPRGESMDAAHPMAHCSPKSASEGVIHADQGELM